MVLGLYLTKLDGWWQYMLRSTFLEGTWLKREGSGSQGLRVLFPDHTSLTNNSHSYWEGWEEQHRGAAIFSQSKPCILLSWGAHIVNEDRQHRFLGRQVREGISAKHRAAQHQGQSRDGHPKEKMPTGGSRYSTNKANGLYAQHASRDYGPEGSKTVTLERGNT